MTRYMRNNWQQSLLAIAVGLSLSTAAQADSWPQQEVGASAAGFTEEGIQA